MSFECVDFWLKTLLFRTHYQRNSTMQLTLMLDTVQDFLIKLGIKPHLHKLKISIFSLNHVIVRPTKIMNNLLKVCKICTFKVIFRYQKSTKSFWIFFSVKSIWLGDQLSSMQLFDIFDVISTLFSKNVPNFYRLCS